VSVLRAAKGNKVAAARQLGIGRTTLYNRLRRYRINHDV
jgi:sigma-54 dependent transcriptional regulator, acetoin dehydrogenase operon transcriptional activator AcoR